MFPSLWIEIQCCLSPGQTDQTLHLTFFKQMFDEMLGLFDQLVWSHNICLAMLDEVWWKSKTNFVFRCCVKCLICLTTQQTFRQTFDLVLITRTRNSYQMMTLMLLSLLVIAALFPPLRPFGVETMDEPNDHDEEGSSLTGENDDVGVYQESTLADILLFNQALVLLLFHLFSLSSSKKSTRSNAATALRFNLLLSSSLLSDILTLRALFTSFLCARPAASRSLRFASRVSVKCLTKC